MNKSVDKKGRRIMRTDDSVCSSGKCDLDFCVDCYGNGDGCNHGHFSEFGE